MTHFRRLAQSLHSALVGVFPSEFRRRHGDELQIDFADDLNACTTAAQLGVASVRAYTDLIGSILREWGSSESLRLLIVAGLSHAGWWLTAVAIAAWQWPGGSRLYPLVIALTVLSVPGVVVAVWRQRSCSAHQDVVRRAWPS